MGANMHKQRILIVDDERDALRILEKELAARGYSIIAADNGNDALNLAKSEHPDLITLDIWMPDMDGSEVAARLKEDLTTKDIPIIFLTCLLQKREEEEEQGRFVAGNVLMAKPYSIRALSTRIRELLTGQPNPQTKS
jgi:DNA-binding response OmpR family regulator